MRIKTFHKEISNHNILKVEVGTNYPMGGDAGHGGRTVFGLKDLSSTAMSVEVNGKRIDYVDEVRIILSGDSEFETFLEALETAVTTLKFMSDMHVTECDA